MSSVTRRCEELRKKQPRGGYIPPNQMPCQTLHDEIELAEKENISPALVGIAVDYLVRFMIDLETQIDEAELKEYQKIDSLPVSKKKMSLKLLHRLCVAENSFRISLMGAEILESTGEEGASETAANLLMQINGLDDKSIISACKLSGYDVCLRAAVACYKPVEEINPDDATIENVRKMVKRSIEFFQKNGPIIETGITFEGGYTDVVDSGDGDYLTEDTIWDLKVSKYPLTKEITLQLLMYYLMGKHSKKDIYKKVKYIGIYNPRQNCVYKLAIKDISPAVIEAVEVDVIGYKPKRKSKNEMDIIDRLSVLKQCYTREELAKRLGVSVTTIGKWKKSGPLPSTQRAVDISRLYEKLEKLFK